jgi:predicted XRE-type DNA-binding protein
LRLEAPVGVRAANENIFRDLGFSPGEAEHLRVRSVLMVHVQEILRARRLTQTQAARMLGVSQPRVSDLLRGRIDLFSADTLIDMLARMGGHLRLVVTGPGKTRRRRNAA